MNKKLKLIIFILLSTLIVNVNFVRGDFDVLPGTTYTYEVVKSNWSLTDGPNSGTGNGLRVGGNSYPIGTHIEIEVLSTTLTSVDYQLDINGNTALNTDSDSETAKLNSFLFYPYQLYGGVGVWDQLEIEMGPHYIFEFFFLEPDAFGFLFNLLNTYFDTQTPSMFWTFDQVGGNYDTDNSVVVFDWMLNTELNDTGCNIYFKGTYYAKIAFDVTTGVLQGVRMQLDYSGSYSGNPLSYDIEQLIKLTSYDLDDFLYSTEPTGYQFLFVLPIFFFSSLFLYVKKKQKKC